MKKVLHKNPFFSVMSDAVQMLEGEVIDPYYYVEYSYHSSAVAIVRDRRELLLVYAWRPLLRQLSWEVPAGRIEEGETAAQAAKREAFEETGIKLSSLHQLGVINTSNGSSTESVTVFCATDPSVQNAVQATAEIRRIGWWSKAKIRQLVKRHEIADGVSLFTLYLAEQLGFF